MGEKHHENNSSHRRLPLVVLNDTIFLAYDLGQIYIIILLECVTVFHCTVTVFNWLVSAGISRTTKQFFFN